MIVGPRRRVAASLESRDVFYVKSLLIISNVTTAGNFITNLLAKYCGNIVASNSEWNIKPRRGRQRKVWSRMVDDLFKSLDIDKSEWLEDIKHGDSSSASFMASVVY